MALHYNNYPIQRLSVCVFLFLFTGADVLASCMDLPWRRGRPYDYYSSETRQPNGSFPTGLKHMVESAHFTPKVQLLREGQNGRQPSDILFVLGSIPNHPGALDAYSRYVKRYKNSKVFKNNRMNTRPKYDPECFFKKALNIYPQKGETYKAWAMHYYRNKKFQKAVDSLKTAMEHGDSGADVHYHLGMSYHALGDLDSARKHAVIAYTSNYPLQGLKQKLDGKF